MSELGNDSSNYQKSRAQEAQQGYAGMVIGSGWQMGECAAGRQSAKSVLRDRARQLHAEAERLEALARALPEELSPQADQALWDLAINARRG